MYCGQSLTNSSATTLRCQYACGLLDEAVDAALRFAQLADETFFATPIGDVRCVIVASPSYLAALAAIEEPHDLVLHQIISMTHFGIDSWGFPPARTSSPPRVIQFSPRLLVNSIRAAVASAVSGPGVTRMLSYHVAAEVEAGLLRIILRGSEHLPLPVNLVAPAGRLSVPMVRTFVDFAAPRPRAHFQRCRQLTDLAADNML